MQALTRFWQYQKERFPIFGHGLLISAFTFSAMSYSHQCREGAIAEDFLLRNFIMAFINAFFIFSLLRISDEFKDKEYDAKHRPQLPVPRGLVSLTELKKVGLAILISLVIVNVLFSSKHLLLFLLILLYMGLMFKEFYLKSFLDKHPLWYVVSHMMIIPLVDTLASSYEWMGHQPDWIGLTWFFAVSFFNGCTLELGRKIKSVNLEEANSYSLSLGFKKAHVFFQAVLFITLVLCLAAANYANMSRVHFLVFLTLYFISAIFAYYFMQNRTDKNSKLFEVITGLWAVFMYLNLGSAMYF